MTEGGFRHLVLDLRHNNGGNGYLNWSLVRELVRTEALDRPDGLFVIVGRRTFSAAMLLSSMLEFHTDAIFVGEPTGSSPQFYGEDTEFQLPYSKLAGSISSRRFQNRFISDDERPWIAPGIVAELTLDDLREGRDPAMQAIRRHLESVQMLRVATAGDTLAARRAGSMTAREERIQRTAIPVGRYNQSSRGSWKETSSQ